MKKYPPSKWYKTGYTRIAPWYFGIMRAEVQMRQDTYDADGINSLFQLKWVGAGRLPRNLANESYYSMLAATEKHNPFLYFWKTLVMSFKHEGDPIPTAPAIREATYRRYMEQREEDRKAYDEELLKGNHD